MISRSRFAALAALFLIWLSMLLVGGPDKAIDRQTLAALYTDDRALLAGVSLLTALGAWVFLIILALAVTIWLFWRGRRRDALLFFTIVLGGRLMVVLQKNLTSRPRPDEMDPVLITHSLSFPSGHAANSMIAYLALALIVFPNRFAIAGAIALSLLIGISRPMLGVHWPSDIIAGWAFGLFWTLALFWFVHQPYCRRISEGKQS